MALLFTDDCFLEHDTGDHPESAERLKSIGRALRASPIAKRFDPGHVQPARHDQLLRVHDPRYLAGVEECAARGGARIEADTVVSERSYDVATRAAGCALSAVDEVLAGRHRQAVCLIRPPGHHALPDRAMGFCLINNVAVAARQAVEAHRLKRVLIVDWDVHHGNGTQDIFDDDERVYFFSAHRHPFYPGTGSSDETGSGPGQGTIFNLPLRFGITRREYKERFSQVLQKAAESCSPELVLISAGFDAHAADPIGSLGLESEDFGELTRQVVQVANEHCRGRLVSLLEGGYNVDALAESVLCHLDALVPADSEAEPQ